MSYVIFTCHTPMCQEERHVTWDGDEDIKDIKRKYENWKCEKHTPPPPPDPKDVALAHACARVDQLWAALEIARQWIRHEHYCLCLMSTRFDCDCGAVADGAKIDALIAPFKLNQQPPAAQGPEAVTG